MTYVDKLFVAVAREAQAFRVGAKRGHQWCHLLADTTEELHEFAARIGMKRKCFQPDNSGGHYDLGPTQRAKAVGLGAKEVTSRELVAIRLARRAKKENK